MLVHFAILFLILHLHTCLPSNAFITHWTFDCTLLLSPSCNCTIEPFIKDLSVGLHAIADLQQELTGCDWLAPEPVELKWASGLVEVGAGIGTCKILQNCRSGIGTCPISSFYTEHLSPWTDLCTGPLSQRLLKLFVRKTWSLFLASNTLRNRGKNLHCLSSVSVSSRCALPP